MVLKLKKTVNEDDMKYITFYSNLKAEIIIHAQTLIILSNQTIALRKQDFLFELKGRIVVHSTDCTDSNNTLESIYSTIMPKIQWEASGWTIDSEIENNINIST